MPNTLIKDRIPLKAIPICWWLTSLPFPFIISSRKTSTLITAGTTLIILLMKCSMKLSLKYLRTKKFDNLFKTRLKPLTRRWQPAEWHSKTQPDIHWLSSDEILLDMETQKTIGLWFKTITMTAQAEINMEVAMKAENAHILACCELKASATEAALNSEATMTPATVRNIIAKEVAAITAKDKCNAKKVLRKNSSGGPKTHTAQPQSVLRSTGQSATAKWKRFQSNWKARRQQKSHSQWTSTNTNNNKKEPRARNEEETEKRTTEDSTTMSKEKRRTERGINPP